MAVDLRKEMVALTRERAEREGVAQRVDVRVADAQALPFDDATFDLVLCESVATFIEDKARVAGELARVVKPEGQVGLNEEIWLQAPTPEVETYAQRVWEIGAKILTIQRWKEVLSNAGFSEIDVYPYAYDPGRESSQIKRYPWQDLARMVWRALWLFLKSRAFRQYMAERKRFPRDLFAYLGYALFVCQR
jgi:SAM-dependent methyltransferase